MSVHFAPALTRGSLRDGRPVFVAVTRCHHVDASDYFNTHDPKCATCSECRSNAGELDARKWQVHVVVNGSPLGAP